MTSRSFDRPRAEVLSIAGSLVDGDRDVDYGHPADSLGRIGRLWGAILDRPDIDAPTVANMLLVMKAARLAANPGHADSWVDAAGYAAIGGELSSGPAH